jgi:hypothetical protein
MNERTVESARASLSRAREAWSEGAQPGNAGRADEFPRSAVMRWVLSSPTRITVLAGAALLLVPSVRGAVLGVTARSVIPFLAAQALKRR